MPFDATSASDVLRAHMVPFAAADRSTQGALAALTAGLSPVLAVNAWLDWLLHLNMSPGKQTELALEAGAASLRLGDTVLRSVLPGTGAPPAADHRFAAPAWQGWPYNFIHQAYVGAESWWRNATSGVRGMSQQNERLVSFGVGQMLHALSPANFLATNPELLRATAERGGRNLVDGVQNFVADARDHLLGRRPENAEFVVGRTLALTPGKVIYRNHLIELIQYAPATPTVFAEPVLFISAWIMKYYILDLRPQNSLIRFLVERGHTVFAISWRNPTAEHREIGMDDYRRSGIMTALDAVERILPGRKVHACGYCLGGTMLSIAAAAMARDGDDRLASLTMLAAQTDFTEPGEMQLFINDATLAWLDALMSEEGYLDGSRMGGAFQLLRAEDLLWAPFVRRYLLGETDHPNDLMVWNADQTRMPYRMHTEYLQSLFLHNDLAQGRFAVAGRPIALADIRAPIFALGTSKDHVAPWRSVFKINLLARSDITFVLASGGHNAGVISEPGHRGRSYQMMTRGGADRYIDPETWLATAPRYEGSWWVDWQRWLAERSGARTAPPMIEDALDDAPGTYVLEP